MVNSKITFFPVGEKNGGMILIRLNDTKKTTILVDCCIGEDLIAEYCDVNEELRNRLPIDPNERPFVDAFILTHRHEDHLKGIQKHFYLGKPEEYPEHKDGEDDKIFIREMWSSHNFWKPSSANYSLCEDAKAFNKEMKRRVKLFEDSSNIQDEGNRAIIIGKDPDGRTDKLTKINYDIGDTFSKINNVDISTKISGLILSPIVQQENEEGECFTNKNRQSIVINLTVKEGEESNKLLLAADAECLVWKTLWKENKNSKEKLEYDILVAPHHCSWHSLSHDDEKDGDPQLSDDAKSALSQNKKGAFIIAQSKVIKEEDDNPPSKAAKDEYLKIVSEDKFICTNEYPNEKEPEPIEFELTSNGPKLKSIIGKLRASHKETPKWKMSLSSSNYVNICGKYRKNGSSWVKFNLGDTLEKNCELSFYADTNVMPSFDVYWQVVNTGTEAKNDRKLRGEISKSNVAGVGGIIQKEEETTKYKGFHWTECFIIKNGVCVARSGEFVVRVK